MIAKVFKMVIVSMLLLVTISTQAQSVNYAKSLINQGRYVEAAKQLRPLADGGNAEAQYLAAKLFFEGRGVNKNIAQGEKYATLSAKQGNENAIALLSTRYFINDNFQKLFAFISGIVNNHPYLEEELPGSILALCYTNGYGTEKDFNKGRQILMKNESWYSQMQEYAPELAEVAPDIVSDVKISNVYGRDQNDKQRTPVYASDNIIGTTYSFQTNKSHNHRFGFIVYNKSNNTKVTSWNSTLSLQEGANSFWSQSKIGPLTEGQYLMYIAEPDMSFVYAQKSFSVQSLAQKAETEWQQKAAQTSVEVNRGGLINARLESVNWRSGSLHVKVAITTPMVRRQFRLGSPYARTTSGSSRSARASLSGLSQEPNRDYHIITDRDVAYITITISGMPSSGELGEVGIDMSLSGSKQFVKVKNIVWR